MDDSDPTCNYAFQTLVALKSQPKKTVLVCAVNDQCEPTNVREKPLCLSVFKFLGYK